MKHLRNNGKVAWWRKKKFLNACTAKQTSSGTRSPPISSVSIDVSWISGVTESTSKPRISSSIGSRNDQDHWTRRSSSILRLLHLTSIHQSTKTCSACRALAVGSPIGKSGQERRCYGGRVSGCQRRRITVCSRRTCGWARSSETNRTTAHNRLIDWAESESTDTELLAPEAWTSQGTWLISTRSSHSLVSFRATGLTMFISGRVNYRVIHLLNPTRNSMSPFFANCDEHHCDHWFSFPSRTYTSIILHLMHQPRIKIAFLFSSRSTHFLFSQFPLKQQHG